MPVQFFQDRLLLLLASKWVKVSFYFLRMQPLCGITSPINGVSTLSWRKKERRDKVMTLASPINFHFCLRRLLTSTGFFNTSPTFSHSLRSKSAGISLSCRFVFRYIIGILLINIKANADTWEVVRKMWRPRTNACTLTPWRGQGRKKCGVKAAVHPCRL